MDLTTTSMLHCPPRSLPCRRQEQAAELGEGVVVGDVLSPESWQKELAGCTHLVILTSAVPKMRPTRNPDDPPEWYYEPGQEVRPGPQGSSVVPINAAGT